MIWEPPNIAQTCPAHTQLTACSSFGYVFLNLVLQLYGDSYDRRVQEKLKIEDCVEDGEVYDFIVVGAGSAGCIVANRLSAVEKWKVLLLEAGPEEPDVTSVPGLSTALLNSNIDWQYKTMPSHYACLAFENQRCQWPRGKTMGGSSAINSFVYIRGNRLDYDDWAAQGNPGWSYDDVRSTMIWEPPNIAQTCPAHTQLTACSSFGYVFLNLVLQLYGDSYDRRVQEKLKIEDCVEDGEVYDFIVVGAGSAGCIVANRLSAVEKWKVLLLEAGPEEPDVTSVPGLSTALLNSNIDWQYKTMPSHYACLAFENQRCQWPRGKTMGGSSAINSFVYIRGNRLDYDDWAAQGNPGWSYDDVLPYFKKSERNMNIEALDRKYHGVNGEQTVSRWPYVDTPSLMLTDAFNERGLPLNDPNGREQVGTMQAQNTADNGVRASANRQFIRSIRYHRKNLKVRPESEVVQILFDTHKRAKGVKYVKNGKLYTAFANKEVIVSGGAINSPKLLLLSGVGPKEHLDELNIPMIADLAVGKNLHDHVTFNGILIALSNKTATSVTQKVMMESVLEHSKMEMTIDPLSANGPVSSVSFYKTDPSLLAPDIQVQVDNTNWREYIREPALYDGLTIFPTAYYDAVVPRVMNLIPYSRGRLLLNASDPHGHPIIYSGYLEDPRDVARIVKGVKMVLSLEGTEAFKSKGASFVKTPLPACRHLNWGTDAYYECLARSYTSCPYHPVGSCKMGPKNDPTAVVDPRLRVYGVSGLRVIDASIMPTVNRGNTNAPSLMIGERGVALVLEDWLHKYKQNHY